MEDCNKQKDPRRVAAGKKAAETRKKKRRRNAQKEQLQEDLDAQSTAIKIGIAAVALAALTKCTLI